MLPTLDEAETIGPIVRRAVREMQERYPLLDEVLVIDSASSDDTRAIAEAEGARVVQHPDVLARYGSFVGKGEALWKSLYETTGDIVVWADTDVRNWHARMVYGTLGPLLVEPRLQYVKGYYQRPIVEGGVLKEGGGGRVTELVARPLINLFFPELSGFIQPLAGEYAGRRSLLEQMPFFTGYAVEIGHLIDAAERAGIEGLGQVDLERRVHRNQELEGLSRMSFVILQAVMKRLEERRRVRLFAELGSTMKLPRSGRGRLVAGGPGARRPRAAADDPDPRVPREARAGDERRVRRLTMADRQLRVLIAPDSFKGSLTSVAVARALADGWLRARPRDDLRLAPLADGGEGTLIAIEAAGGWQWREADATDPLGRPIRARWLRRDDGRAAVVEMAAASGLSLVAAPERDAARATSRGTGDVLRAVLDAGIRDIALGIGGSATTDGGAGILRSLGARGRATTWRRSTSTASTRGSPRLACGSRAT